LSCSGSRTGTGGRVVSTFAGAKSAAGSTGRSRSNGQACPLGCVRAYWAGYSCRTRLIRASHGTAVESGASPAARPKYPAAADRAAG
jgi:hypothetical protein